MRQLTIIFLVALLLCACSSIDCPLNNVVLAKYVLKGNVSTLEKTLTINLVRAGDRDSTWLNQIDHVTDFVLPMSYANETDVLVFLITDSTSTTIVDIVRVTKTNEPHFESVDCAPNYFHTIKDVTWTQNAIDSIIIAKAKVNYDTTGGNLHIYFKSDD